MAASPARRARAEAGSILVLFVFALAAVGAILALTVNFGHLYSVHGGLQNGADAAALAAAARLDGTQAGLDAGEAAAEEVAKLHVTDAGERIEVDPAADLSYGSWDKSCGFVEIAGRGAADLRLINAVRVRDGREAARGNAVPIVFGGAFVDLTHADVSSEAVAAGGGPCEEDCAFPAAVAACRLLDDEGALRCGQILVLNEDYQDGLGLTSLAPDVAPTRSHVEAALAELQSGGCPPATRAGDSLPVSNGVRMQYIVDEPYFAGLPRTVTLPVVEGDACPEPYYEACVPDHPGPNGTCTNATFVGDRAVTGYATFRVCHVTGPSVSTWPPPGWPAECGAAPGPGDFNGVPSWPGFLAHSVFLQLVCGVERDGARAGRAGCGQFGTSSPRSTLVQ